MSKRIKLTDFQPDEKNFNKHSQLGMSLLEKSVEQVGVIESITVSADDKIISGNARQEVMNQKFDGIEPIIVESDGKRPIIIKRKDIKSNTAQFHTAALLANTVAKHNIRLDEEKIQEVAVEEYNIDVQELGVFPEKEEEQGGPLGIYPLSIILNAKEYKDFQLYKKENGIRTDTEAFKQLFTYKTLE
ncbi:MAG: hypothetical protein KF862_07285 [Chitinophagaceae bacterium]|nr:hypothetical protein [Chitinophagaceae bacterium]